MWVAANCSQWKSVETMKLYKIPKTLTYSYINSDYFILVRDMVNSKPVMGKLGIKVGIHPSWNGSQREPCPHKLTHSFTLRAISTAQPLTGICFGGGMKLGNQEDVWRTMWNATQTVISIQLRTRKLWGSTTMLHATLSSLTNYYCNSSIEYIIVICICTHNKYWHLFVNKSLVIH